MAPALCVQAGEVVRVCGPEDTRALEARVRAMAAAAAGVGQAAGGAAASPAVLVMDAQDWKVGRLQVSLHNESVYLSRHHS